MPRNMKSLQERVVAHDNAKKVNPLDLSSDQDLTIGIMNLIAIRNQTNADIHKHVGDLCDKLLGKVADTHDAAVWNLSVQLLALCMQFMTDGNRALDAGRNSDAYAIYGDAYGAYSMFWGLNMNLVDVDTILSEIKNMPNKIV